MVAPAEEDLSDVGALVSTVSTEVWLQGFPALVRYPLRFRHIA
jgi:hypothetical protein